MSDYLAVLEKLNKFDTKCDDVDTLHKRLNSFRSLMEDLGNGTREAHAAGGEYAAVLTAMAPAGMVSVTICYNGLLKSAQRLGSSDESLVSQEPLEIGDSQYQLAWMRGRIDKEMIPLLDVIYSAYELEHEADGCFIATASLGSPSHPDLTLLRRFRDDRVLLTSGGRWLVRLYYRVGPSAARIIGERRVLRAVSRWLVVWPLVYLVRLFDSGRGDSANTL